MPVLIAVAHDILITAGVYSLTGREVSSATVAAFLTILGYSLYDTVIVFDRIRENVPRMPRAAFSQIVNRSMSEVLTRSLITGLSSVFLVTVLLIFGGATLQDFAFAMMVGILSGTYSSIFIASPVLNAWKEREPGFVRRRERIAEARRQRARLRRRDRAGAARRRRERPTRSSRRSSPPSASRSRRRARWRRSSREPAGDGGEPSSNGEPPAADPASAERRERNDAAANAASSAANTGGSARRMALVVWFTMGLALWHFTVFLPDRFWQGIVGALLGATLGAVLFGAVVQVASGSGLGDTDLRTALIAIPGTAIGLAVVWAIGVRQEQSADTLA